MRASSYDYAREIEGRIEALSNEDYLRRPRDAKRLIEELYPLSRFALAMKQPGLRVDVEGFENSGRPDGHIWITGYVEKDFEVQITYAGYEGNDALRSRLLVQDGFAPGAGPISKDKKIGEIIATMEAEDIDSQIKKLGVSIYNRIRMKTTNDTYIPGTVLLVAFDEVTLRGRGCWSILYSAIDASGGVDKGRFAQVFLFNCCSNELQQAA